MSEGVAAGAARGGLARRIAPALVSALLVLLVLVPPLSGAFTTWVATNVLVLALFASGFNLLFGYTGLLSFGHAGLFAVGAYVSAYLLLLYPSLPVAILAGVVATGLVSLVIGYLSIRHTRIYFAMITLAFGMMIWSTIFKWRGVTGGDDGLVGVPRGMLGFPGLGGIDMSSQGRFYYLVLILTVVGVAVLWRIVHSPLGLVLQGLRDSETRVAFAGLPVRRYRLMAFVVSGLYAGLAGSMAAPLVRAATPSMAHWTFSAEPVLATLLGGSHTFGGPIVGAFLLEVMKEFIVRYTEYWLLVLGSVVIGLVLLFRGGVASVFLDVVWPRARAMAKR